jgi:LPXTG-motif cell wall-anchored protein
MGSTASVSSTSYSVAAPVASGTSTLSGSGKTLAVTGSDGSAAAGLGAAGLLALVSGGALLLRRHRATV